MVIRSACKTLRIRNGNSVVIRSACKTLQFSWWHVLVGGYLVSMEMDDWDVLQKKCVFGPLVCLSDMCFKSETRWIFHKYKTATGAGKLFM